MRPFHLPAAAVLCCAACAPEPAPAAAAPAAPAVERPAERPAAAPAVERAARVTTEAVAALRRALEFGDVEAARRAIAGADAAGPEATLLRARLAVLEGRYVDAMRLVEVAKSERPRDPDTYATAAEVYASRDAFDTAWIEIRRGTDACGETAEILRAKGIAWISRENGAERGLAALLAARKLDPGLPFCDRALGQAHLLMAKAALKAEKLDDALREVRAALAHDPGDVDTRRLLADVLGGLGDFEGAIAEIRALVAQGSPLRGELALLHKRAGFARLMAQDRAGAIEQFLEARALGLSDEELSSAADILLEESRARLDAGTAAYAQKDLAAAETAFRAALDLDPLCIPAKNHLAVVRFQRGDPTEAARLWRGVLDEARAAGIRLPEPVHVNLAKAEVLRGERAAARAVLSDYLRDEPEGEWTGMTRALLAQIESEER